MDAQRRRSEEPARARLVTLLRHSSGPQGTFGTWVIPDGPSFDTVELPWRGNRAFESCIPPGVYRLRLRRSDVVERSSGGRFLRGWEIVGVPQRELIMLHVANTIDDLDGCVGVGRGRGWVGERPAVLNSRPAFADMMRAMDPRLTWDVDIRYASGLEVPEWP